MCACVSTGPARQHAPHRHQQPALFITDPWLCRRRARREQCNNGLKPHHAHRTGRYAYANVKYHRGEAGGRGRSTNTRRKKAQKRVGGTHHTFRPLFRPGCNFNSPGDETSRICGSSTMMTMMTRVRNPGCTGVADDDATRFFDMVSPNSVNLGRWSFEAQAIRPYNTLSDRVHLNF